MSMQDALRKITGIDGIQGCMIVSRDGLILDNAGDIDASLTSVAAISSSALGAAEVMGEAIELGMLQQQVLEFDKGKAIVQQVNPNLLLLVVANDKANLGMIRHTINSVLDDLKATLS